jgi:hypothetical protein
LNKLLAKGGETADMGKEAQSVTKSAAKKAQDDIPTEHMGPGDAVANSEEEGNKKNKAAMNSPDKIENADNEIETLKAELADMKAFVKSIKESAEFQDMEIPAYGGTNKPVSLDRADMSAEQRATEFGDYGKWDACFNGAANASRFKR